MAENFYQLEIESNPNNLLTVEEFVNYFARDVNLDEDRIPGLLLAVTEATTNAIIHGNKSDESKSVVITVKVEENKLIISIKDQGPGFDPSSIPDPTHPDNLLKDSGRGLYLMRIYMDDLQYRHSEDGTETILIMRL